MTTESESSVSSNVSEEIISLKQPHKTFGQKAPALEHIEKIKDPNLYLFSYDVGNNSAKNFIPATYKEVFNYMVTSPNEKNYYENFELTDALKLYIDVDIKEEQMKNKDRDQEFDSVVNEIIELTNQLLKKKGISKLQIIILRSKNKTGKLSGHIVYNNVVFENVHHMGYFFMNNDSYLIKDKILDPRAYKVGCLRMVWASKKNKENDLEFYKAINIEVDLSSVTGKKEFFRNCCLKTFDKEHHYVKTNYNDKLKSIEYNTKRRNIIKQKMEKIKKTIHPNIALKITELDEIDQMNETPIEEIRKYVRLLAKKRAEDYNEWITIGMAIYNSNINAFDVFDEFSKNVQEKYDYRTNVIKWNSFHKHILSMGTIKWAAKKDNPHCTIILEQKLMNQFSKRSRLIEDIY